MSTATHPHPAAEAFSRHYDAGKSGWGGTSGPGSNPYFTIEYRAFLEKFIRMNGVRSIVDFGCGDWQFSRYINFEGAKYLGIDVVDSIIDRNIAEFKSEAVNFMMAPGDLSLIPAADLLIIKDVLQHLPDQQIFQIRDELFGKFRHILLTNSFRKLNTARNIDIKIGQFRCLDLASPPYSFQGSYVLEFSSPVWEYIRTFIYYR